MDVGVKWEPIVETREGPVSRCHWCRNLIEHRRGGWYQDSLGRWEYCGACYVHRPHPAGETLAWWYAVERLAEINNERRACT